ncbi:hypothetical protein G5714_013691 [Onychostoma macrolepis]|uniref:Uncharacterized protein n=1 Tax=Onychostoma macrolepis TaxID=369639 RepID=A0A7J6CFE0_9TELE|nr:hypothetical protein G5714_013691 [Onychostoma macrolepis]
METANHSMEMEKCQIAISSSSKRDKDSNRSTSSESESCYQEDSNRSTSSESESCYQEDSNGSTRSESPACKGTLACVFQAKDLLHLLQGHICVFQILGPFGAPGDQHPPALRVQGCRNGFLLLSSLHCYQHNQLMKSPPPDC